jgi:hypothetical protein
LGDRKKLTCTKKEASESIQSVGSNRRCQRLAICDLPDLLAVGELSSFGHYPFAGDDGQSQQVWLNRAARRLARSTSWEPTPVGFKPYLESKIIVMLAILKQEQYDPK